MFQKSSFRTFKSTKLLDLKKQNLFLVKFMVKSTPGFSQLRKSPNHPPVIVFTSLRLCPYAAQWGAAEEEERAPLKSYCFSSSAKKSRYEFWAQDEKKKILFSFPRLFAETRAVSLGKCKRRFHTLKKGRGEKNDFFNCPPALAPLAACNFPRKSLFPLPVNKKEKIAPVGFFPFFVYCRHVPFPRFVRRYFLLFFRGNGLPRMGEGEENGGSIQNLVWLSGESLRDNMSKTLFSHTNMIHLMHTYNTNFLHWWQIKLPLTFPMSTCTWCAKF